MAKRVSPKGVAAALGALGGGGSGAMPGIPGVRKPTRGALGGASPAGARTRMPPTVATAGARGGKKKAVAPKRKAAKK